MVNKELIIKESTGLDELKELVQELCIFIVEKETNECVIKDCYNKQLLESEYCLEHNKMVDDL